MGWMVKDFVCADCGHSFEQLYYKQEGEDPEIECVECGSRDTNVHGISSPRIGTYEMADAEGKAEILRKRSADHTKRQILRDADRFGLIGKARRDEYLKK